MGKLAVLNIKGEKVSDITLNKNVWDITPNDAVLYDAIVLAMASRRQGTHDTKTRSEVSGGGRKPYRQKGTGHARQGSIRAPHYPGGGIVFGPHPRKYNKKQNRKERVLALKSALAYKNINKEIIALDNLKLESNKTKEMLKVLDAIKASKNILIVTNELDDNVILASRNIPNTVLLGTNEISVLDVIAADTLVITTDAIKAVEEVLG